MWHISAKQQCPLYLINIVNVDVIKFSYLKLCLYLRYNFFVILSNIIINVILVITWYPLIGHVWETLTITVTRTQQKSSFGPKILPAKHCVGE